jgi:hypothetical protein
MVWHIKLLVFGEDIDLYMNITLLQVVLKALLIIVRLMMLYLMKLVKHGTHMVLVTYSLFEINMKKYKKISWKKVIIYVLLKGYNEPIKHILPTIKKNTIGQPVLSSGYISISHSTTYDAYAISKTLPVGIDIEPCNRTTKDNKIPNIKT